MGSGARVSGAGMKITLTREELAAALVKHYPALENHRVACAEIVIDRHSKATALCENSRGTRLFCSVVRIAIPIETRIKTYFVPVRRRPIAQGAQLV